jgi:hypothetical protein
MRNKSIFYIVNVSRVTTEKALEIIKRLSKNQILEQDRNGNTILHMLVPSEQDGWDISFDLEQVVKAIVAKNAKVLNLRSIVKYNDPKTNKVKIIKGDNALVASIRHNSLQLLKILAPHYQNEFKVFDYQAGEQREMTPEEKQKTKEKFDEPDDFRLPTIKILDNEREFVSPLAFTLRYGQFEMFKYLFKNGFGEEIKGAEDRSKYNLNTTEGLKKLYKDLFVAGNKELLKGLHRCLGYYEGHNDQNSPELIAAVKNDNKELALDLISQGHYVYDFSGFDCFSDRRLLKYFFLNNFNHPNYNILAKDKQGNTPLHEAAIYRYTKMVKSLLEKGADMNTKNEFGCTPMCLAVSNGNTDTVRLLLEKGADVNANNNGHTLLEWALIYNNEEIAELLLAHGACPSLSALLLNTCSAEINSTLRKVYIKSHVYNAFYAFCDSLEGAVKALSGDITAFYDEQQHRLDSQEQNPSNHR